MSETYFHITIDGWPSNGVKREDNVASSIRVPERIAMVIHELLVSYCVLERQNEYDDELARLLVLEEEIMKRNGYDITEPEEA